MPDYQQYFEREYNRRLGNQIGRPMDVPDYVTPGASPIPSGKRVRRLVSTGVVNLDSDVENSFEDMFGEAAVGGGNTSSSAIMRRIMHDTTRDINRSNKEFQKKVDAYQKQIEEQFRIDAAAKQYQEEHKPSGLSKVVSTALRYLDKPMNAVEGVLEEGPRNDQGTGDEYFNWSQIWKGLSQGFNQKKNYDMGRVMEQYFPSAPHPVKIAGAVAGNLFLDPTNLVGLKSIKYAAEGKKVLDSARLADTTVDAVRRALRKTNIPYGSRALRMPAQAGAPAIFGTAQQATEAALEQVVRDTVVKQTLNLSKGGRKIGRFNIGRSGLADRLNIGSRAGYAATHAGQGVEAVRKTLFSRYEDFVERFRTHIRDLNNGGRGTLSAAAIRSMRAGDQYFDDFWNRVNQAARGRVSPTQWEAAMDSADEAVRRGLDKPMEDLMANIADEVAGSYHHAPALRIGAATIPMKTLGKALEWVGEKALPKALDMDKIRSLSHAGMFPGKLALLQQKGRAMGVKKLEDFEREVSRIARQFTRDERLEITRALENSAAYPFGFPHNPRLQAGLDYVRQELDRMWDEEIRAGARSPGSPKLDNYTYVWNRKGNSRALGDWKKARKDQIVTSGGSSAGNFNIAGAKASGFKPVEDAFDMVLMRQIKSNRDMTRALFYNDLIDNYGFAARGLSSDAATRRNLESMDFNKLSEHMRSRIDPDAGDKFYLPKVMHGAYRDFEDLSRFSTDPTVLRWIRKVTNFFKAGATVYNPGYHIRNIMSDFVMGLLDGVRTNTYTEMMRKGAVKIDRAAGERLPRFRFRTGARFHIGGKGANEWITSADELQNIFKNNAAGGGFFGPEFGRNPVTSIFSKINQGVRKASEVREDFGRMGHFLSALRDEYDDLIKKGMSRDAAQLKAIEQATYRVNHFKFDYGALTKWEQKYMKAAVPFYTFARKAVPTLTESFAMNPKWLRRYGALRNSFEGDDSKNFNSFFIPQHIKDMGYAVLKDEKEPWVATMETLPTGAFSSILPNEWTPAGIADTFVQQLNPVIQAPFEIRSGKEFYANRDVGSLLPKGMSDIGYLARKFVAPASNLSRGYEDIKGGDSWLKTLMTNRLAAGLPIRKISTEQMDYARKAWEDKAIQGLPTSPIDSFNEGDGANKGIRVYLSQSKSTGMSSYKVKDDNTGKVLFESASPWDAINYAKNSGTHSQIDTNLEEFNDTEGKSARVRVYYSDRKDGSSYRVKDTKTDKVLKDFKNPQKAIDYARQRAAG